MTPEEIITDEEITRVHANANFGTMTPRDVVNDGVRKYAVGYTGGSTQVAILREHGLITKPLGNGYRAGLTEKGKRYARSIYARTLADAMKLPEVRALFIAAEQVIFENDEANPFRTADFHGASCDCLRCVYDKLRTALAPFTAAKDAANG